MEEADLAAVVHVDANEQRSERLAGEAKGGVLISSSSSQQGTSIAASLAESASVLIAWSTTMIAC